MKIIILHIIVLFLMITSCENVDIVETEIPFKDFTIVRGVLSPNETNIEVSFSKSTPINGTSNYDNRIENVISYIKVSSAKVYTLENIGEGVYSPITELNLEFNSHYELFANIEGNRIYARTFLPPEPNVINTFVINDQVQCEILPVENVVYTCLFTILTNNSTIIAQENDFHQVVGPFSNLAETIIVKSSELPSEYRSSNILSVEVFAWDKSYKPYFETKNNNKPIEDVFLQSGGSIKWNVQGNNTIGLFIGYSTTKINDI